MLVKFTYESGGIVEKLDGCFEREAGRCSCTRPYVLHSQHLAVVFCRDALMELFDRDGFRILAVHSALGGCCITPKHIRRDGLLGHGEPFLLWAIFLATT